MAEFKFSRDESGKNELFASSKIPIEKLLGETKRADDALLTALSLVLSANSDYAKSMSKLLENGMTGEQAFNLVDDRTAELIDLTKKLIDSQETLTTVLTQNKEELDALIVKLNKEQQDFLDKKFGYIFTQLGLTKTGEEHAPADKIVVKLKHILTRELYILAAGAILYQLLLLLGKKYGLN